MQPGSSVGARRVLVVEDNADAATLLRMVLELGGHQVAVAHDGRSALQAARSFAPQVVLCDIGLPDIDGYTLARRLKASSGNPPVLVALTGYGQEEDRRRAMDAGFDHHLTKPVDPSVLERLAAGLAA